MPHIELDVGNSNRMRNKNIIAATWMTIFDGKSIL